jgi:hypothetical protein
VVRQQQALMSRCLKPGMVQQQHGGAKICMQPSCMAHTPLCWLDMCHCQHCRTCCASSLALQSCHPPLPV